MHSQATNEFGENDDTVHAHFYAQSLKKAKLYLTTHHKSYIFLLFLKSFNPELTIKAQGTVRVSREPRIEAATLVEPRYQKPEKLQPG